MLLFSCCFTNSGIRKFIFCATIAKPFSDIGKENVYKVDDKARYWRRQTFVHYLNKSTDGWFKVSENTKILYYSEVP